MRTGRKVYPRGNPPAQARLWQLCGPGATATSEGRDRTPWAVTLPAAPAQQDHRYRLEHDPEVFGRRLALQVLQVVMHLGPHIFQRAIVVMIDLSQSGDPRPGPLPQRVLRDVLPQLGKDGGPLGAGAHDVHLAPEHVDQLGQLVQAVLPQEPADRGDPRIALLGPHRTTLMLGVDPHGAELVNRERPSTDVPLTPLVLFGVHRHPAVESHPHLGVKNRARRGEPDQEGDQQEQRKEQNQCNERYQDVQPAAWQVVALTRPKAALVLPVDGPESLDGGEAARAGSLDQRLHPAHHAKALSEPRSSKRTIPEELTSGGVENGGGKHYLCPSPSLSIAFGPTAARSWRIRKYLGCFKVGLRSERRQSV